jgi:hypothetical protein
MREHAPDAGMSLYGSAGSRKYLNAAERRRVTKAARRTPVEVELFCLVLSLSGARISEILALTPAGIDLDSGVANIITLFQGSGRNSISAFIAVIHDLFYKNFVTIRLAAPDRLFEQSQRNPDSTHTFLLRLGLAA